MICSCAYYTTILIRHF